MVHASNRIRRLHIRIQFELRQYAKRQAAQWTRVISKVFLRRSVNGKIFLLAAEIRVKVRKSILKSMSLTRSTLTAESHGLYCYLSSACSECLEWNEVHLVFCWLMATFCCTRRECQIYEPAGLCSVSLERSCFDRCHLLFNATRVFGSMGVPLRRLLQVLYHEHACGLTVVNRLKSQMESPRLRSERMSSIFPSELKRWCILVTPSSQELYQWERERERDMWLREKRLVLDTVVSKSLTWSRGCLWVPTSSCWLVVP